jgi:hypothetical protein
MSGSCAVEPREVNETKADAISADDDDGVTQ